MEKRTNKSPMVFEWKQGHGPVDPDSPFFKVAADKHEDGFSAGHTPKLPIQRRNPSSTTPHRPIKLHYSDPENDSSRGSSDKKDTSGRQREGRTELCARFEQAEVSCNSYTDAIPRRVYKRRRRNADRHVSLVQNQNTSHDSDFVAPHRPNRKEADISSRQGNTSGAPQRMTLIPSILTFIENHPNLPHILSYYTQFLLNIFIVFLMMHLVYCFWSTIRSDVDLKSREVVSETLAEMAVCNREFEGNRCKRSSRVPAMEKMCDYWEECMKQDPLKVARAGVSANAFAEILNNFFEPITAKTVIVSFIVIFGCFVISNMTLMLIRNKISAFPPPPQGAYQTPLCAHPYSYSQQMYPEQYLIPYQDNTQEMSGPRQEEETKRSSNETPTKRLGYR